MTRRLDLTGARYGRLIVLEEVEPRGKYRRYLCQCDCGNKTVVNMNDLRSGNTKSCGCLHKDAGKRVAKFDETRLKHKGVATQLLQNKVRKDSTTGIKGVYAYQNNSGTIVYRATIGIKGKEIYLGTYDTIEDAAEARKHGEAIYHEPYLKEVNLTKQQSRLTGSAKGIHVRVPEDLHRKIVESAEQNHRSINAEILYHLEQVYRGTC